MKSSVEMEKSIIGTYAYKQARMIHLLREMEQTLRVRKEIPKRLANWLDVIRETAADFGYLDTARHIEKRIKDLKKGFIKKEDLPSDIKNIRERLEDDAKKLNLIPIDDDKIQYYAKLYLFGEVVAAKFPDAQRDLTEAGSCYALGRPTACILHLMRALESSLKVLASMIPGFQFAYKDTMGMIVTKLQKLADHLPSGTHEEIERKQNITKAAHRFHDITQAMRNSAMHTGEFYSAKEAHHALASVEYFLKDLANIVT